MQFQSSHLSKPLFQQIEPLSLICFDISLTTKHEITPEELNQFGSHMTTESDSVINEINQLLESKLEKEIEGKCNSHGLVMKGSTKILTRSIGEFVNGVFNGHLIFNIQYKITICNPAIGVILPVRIVGRNPIALLSEFVPFLKEQDYEHDSPPKRLKINKQFAKYPLLISIPKQIHNTEAEQKLYESIQVNDNIQYIAVCGKKFDLQDRQIGVLGKLSTREQYETQFANLTYYNEYWRTE